MVQSDSPPQRVVLGIGGGIAAYKLCEVASTLAKAGVEVRPVLTAAAQQFVAPLTFATLCRHRAYTDADFWQPTHPRPLHIDLGEWADLLVLAPLTANTLGKLAHGLADNLLTNTVLASTCPVLLAPAMNTDMWQQPAVQANWQQVMQQSRYHGALPGAGRLACDRIGPGRLAEPAELVAWITSLLHTGGQRDLSGQRVVISAGGTREYLDPVRFIGNPATGKMGVALAQAALHRGAQVTLIHGPMAAEVLALVPGIERIATPTAAEMATALLAAQPQADWIIMAAAVADVRPETTAAHKLPKADLPANLPLAPVPDIAAQLNQRRSHSQRLVGFAAQTGEIVAPAQAKLMKKGFDAIAANPVDQANAGFGSNDNIAVFLHRNGSRQDLPPCSKLAMAHALLDFCQHHEGRNA